MENNGNRLTVYMRDYREDGSEVTKDGRSGLGYWDMGIGSWLPSYFVVEQRMQGAWRCILSVVDAPQSLAIDDPRCTFPIGSHHQGSQEQAGETMDE